MLRALSLPWCNAAPVPGDATSFLLASLHCFSLADVVQVRCLQKVCATTVPALRWGTPFHLLFSLSPVMTGLLACTGAHRLASSVHRLRHILRECLEYQSGENSFLPPLPGSGHAPLALPLLCCTSPVAAGDAKAAYVTAVAQPSLEDLEPGGLGS